MPDIADRWLTTAEAAAYCGYESKGGIAKAVARGELRPDGATPGGAHRWRRATLDAFNAKRGYVAKVRATKKAKRVARRETKAAKGPRPEFIYFVSDGLGHVKIGITNDVEKRIAYLQVGCAGAMERLAHMMGTQETEKKIHAQFASHRHRGEWFKDSDELRDLIRNVVSKASWFVGSTALPIPGSFDIASVILGRR